ncbi:hypothetical protein ACE1SV_74800 [Streptomyces sennicomposti]
MWLCCGAVPGLFARPGTESCDGERGSLVRLMPASHTATLERLPQLIAGHAAAAGSYDVS